MANKTINKENANAFSNAKPKVLRITDENGQETEWEEVSKEQYVNEFAIKTFAVYQREGETKDRYYKKLPPKDVFPKVFGRYEVNTDGEIFDLILERKIMDLRETNDLKQAIAESDKIRGKNEIL